MTGRELILERIKLWKVASAEMDRERGEWLRSLGEEESARLINEAMRLADGWLALNGPQDRDSGLVEQQRIFMRAHAAGG
jgi:hypothetical protein